MVNLNNFTADLTRRVAEEFHATDKQENQLLGKIVTTALASLQEQESTSQPSTTFDNDWSQLDVAGTENRLQACKAIISHLETNGPMTGIRQRIHSSLEEQRGYLQQLTDAKQDLEQLKEESLDVARKMLERAGDYSEMSPADRASYYELWKARNGIEALKTTFTTAKTPLPEELEELSRATKTLEGAPFLEKYRQFESDLEYLKRSISNLRGSDVEVYFKLLIQKCDEIDHVVNSSPIDEVIGNLPSKELKLCFYCIVKFQDEIQAIFYRMKSEGIFWREINLDQLEKLSNLAAKTESLKHHCQPAVAKPQIPARAENLTLYQAEKCRSDALAIIASTPSAAAMTDIQELLWRSALGYMQNGKPEEARKSLSLAALHLPTVLLESLEARLQSNPQNGIFLSNFGTSYNKEQSVHVTDCLVDKARRIKMDFTLNGHGVEGLDALMKGINPQSPEQILQMLPEGFCTSVSISKRERHKYDDYRDGTFVTGTPGYQMPDSPQTVFEFAGVGKVIVGNRPEINSPEIKCLSNMVFVEAIPGHSLDNTMRNIQTMLAVLGIPPVLVETREKDHQIKALLHVFRAFYPRDAALIEREGLSYQLKPEEIHRQIIGIKPEMKAIFDTHLTADFLPKKVRELATGKSTTSVSMGEEMKKRGALGLMAGMEGDIAHRARILSRILRPLEQGGMGMISSQLRFINGIISIGTSSYTDHREGGAAGVFTRLVTREIAASKTIANMPFHGSIQILIDLQAADAANSYGFESDRYGTRSSGDYFSRKSLIELTEALQRPVKKLFGTPVEIEKYGTANEVVIRDSISPELIKGIVVASQEDKRVVISQLIDDKLLENISGVWHLGKTSIDQFIKVSETFTQEMWDD